MACLRCSNNVKSTAQDHKTTVGCLIHTVYIKYKLCITAETQQTRKHLI